MTTRSRALAHAKVPLLWIRAQDSLKAERAFLTINRAAVQIDPTELKILNSRFKPNAISARAIVRRATGHKYWNSFSASGQGLIENLGSSIHAALYSPELSPPIRTTDLPIAGPGYGSQTLPLIFDFVNIANDIPVVDASKKKRDPTPVSHDPANEEATLKALKMTSKLAQRMTGKHPSSLGLSPAVYFYSANGRHQPTAVLAMSALLMDLEKANGFDSFTAASARFEQFLVEHKMFVNQMTTQYGSMAKGYRQLKDYFAHVLQLVIEDKSTDEIVSNLRDSVRYQRLVKERPIKSTKSKDFSQDIKQLVYLRDALEKSIECSICSARIDTKAMQLDHEKGKQEGGTATSENAKWTHPYCNSTFKKSPAGVALAKAKKAANLA